MERTVYEQYMNKYSVSKTLRFELKPQGKTQKYIEARGLLSEDEERAENYKIVKRVLDEYYKNFIERALRNLELNKIDLYYTLYLKHSKTDKEQKEFEKMETDLRKQVGKCLKEDEKFNILFKKEIIIKELGEAVKDENDRKAVDSFKNFTTYFQGFFENRKNVFSDEAKSTSVAYRIVHDNLPKYIDNMHIFEIIMSTELCQDIYRLQTELKDDLGGRRVEDFFKLTNYSRHTVTNKDIVLYNTLLGGKTLEDGTKIKGINEYVNLFNQANANDKMVRKIPKLKILFKQILADKETLAFRDEEFESDEQVLDTVNLKVKYIYENVLKSDSDNSIEKLFDNMASYDLNRIYVVNDQTIADLSNAVFGDWSVIKAAFEKEYDSENVKKARNEKYYEARSKVLKNRKSYSIAQINQTVEKYMGIKCNVENYYVSMVSNDDRNMINIFNEAYDSAQELLNTEYKSKYGLSGDKRNVTILKQLLDSIKSIEAFVKPLLGTKTEADKDDVFYGELEEIYSVLSVITTLYNKVRNYVTRKPYSEEKIKLNFQNPTLLNGWDKNKEKDNLAIICRKEGLYYLGIMNKSDNKIFDSDIETDGGEFYEKMEYKLLPGPNKMLPKVFFADSNKEHFAPPEDVMEIYNSGSYKKGENFNLEYCHRLIDYFKASINKHKDWSKFGFKFSDTSEYEDISQFYHEVEKQGYLVSFRKIPVSYIDEMVDSGRLYFFQIYNKDFSEFSKGTPNLHTVYWRMLFDERNLKDVVYKLNGEAEVFFRKASIDEESMVIHEKGIPILKKNLKAREKKETSLFEYDLIKDKRYTVDKYQFHVPVTMNFCAEGRTYINDEVIQTIREHLDINVIGIDRGERNLLYISVINPDGKIIHQQSLNVIESDKGYKQDYNALLYEKTKREKEARKNWLEIESIKELKAGYLSQAVHIITDLMLKYNAIVVLEDLNFGFKNGRKKVGKEVYQKFEKALIDKLNYLADKNADAEEAGGMLHAYQLTNSFESFAKLGKQSGFLFYIPAWNTSKIDPTTGFVNLLYPKYVNEAEAKKFIEKFDEIKYNENDNYFEFSFAYSKFIDKALGTQDKWTICSYGTRIVNFRNPLRNSEWDFVEVDITEQIKQHFQQVNVDITKGNLIAEICKINNPKFFREFIEDIKLVLQIRNSIINSDTDYMISPVKNADGEFFDTRKYDEKIADFNYFPENADANGAYNIARKGLMIMDKIRKTEDKKLNLTISNKEWMDYAQKNVLLK